MGLKDWTIDPAPFTRLARQLEAFYAWPAERELRRRRLVDRGKPVGDHILRLGTPPSLSDLIEAKLEALDARDRIVLAAREDFRRGKGRPLTELQQAVLDYVREHPHCESGDIAAALDRSKESVRQIIRRLRHRGLVAPETDPPTGYLAL